MATTTKGSALSAQPTADDAGWGLFGARRIAAIAAVLAAMVLVVLDAAILNVALPTIARALHETAAMSVRIITAYQMGLMMALLPCAALGESRGYRLVFTLGVTLFTGASALCALSPSLPWLIAACFLQGLGGAAVMALSVALLRFIVPQRQLGAAIGWNALTVALSYAAGPTIGAVILARAGWPWLFAINLPLGIAVMLACRALPHVAGTRRQLDVLSVALNNGGFAALVVGAELLPARPALAVVLIAAAGLTFAALVRREMPSAAPLIPLDLLRDGSFRISVIASVCCFAGQMMGLVALPFYLQHGLGQSTLTTGLYLTPWPLAVAIAAPIVGGLVNRASTARLCVAGSVCLSMGLTAASLWPLQGDLRPLVPVTMLCGLGCALFQVPNNRIMFLSAPRARSGAAGGMQATARLAGQISGAVIMTLLFALAPVDAAPRLGLGIAAALTLTAGFVSMVRSRPKERNATLDRSIEMRP
jgi:DHA2 family multidrug resistance protein-like MFS transporter